MLHILEKTNFSLLNMTRAPMITSIRLSTLSISTFLWSAISNSTDLSKLLYLYFESQSRPAYFADEFDIFAK